MKKWFILLLFPAMIASLPSCQKENPVSPKSESGLPVTPFSKTLSLSDGANHITLRVSSNDAALVNDVDAQNFEFTAMLEIPDTTRRDEAPTGMQAPAPESAHTSLVFELIDAQIQPEVKGIGLQYLSGDQAENRSPVDIWCTSEGGWWSLGLQGIMAMGLPFYVEGWYSGSHKMYEPGWRVFTIRMDWLGAPLRLHITQSTLLDPLFIFIP